MAKQANIFAFSPLITDTWTHQHIHRHETLSKKVKLRQMMVYVKILSLVPFSVNNTISLSLHKQVNEYVS